MQAVWLGIEIAMGVRSDNREHQSVPRKWGSRLLCGTPLYRAGKYITFVINKMYFTITLSLKGKGHVYIFLTLNPLNSIIYNLRRCVHFLNNVLILKTQKWSCYLDWTTNKTQKFLNNKINLKGFCKCLSQKWKTRNWLDANASKQ